MPATLDLWQGRLGFVPLTDYELRALPSDVLNLGCTLLKHKVYQNQLDRMAQGLPAAPKEFLLGRMGRGQAQGAAALPLRPLDPPPSLVLCGPVSPAAGGRSRRGGAGPAWAQASPANRPGTASRLPSGRLSGGKRKAALAQTPVEGEPEGGGQQDNGKVYYAYA